MLKNRLILADSFKDGEGSPKGAQSSFISKGELQWPIKKKCLKRLK